MTDGFSLFFCIIGVEELWVVLEFGKKFEFCVFQIMSLWYGGNWVVLLS